MRRALVLGGGGFIGSHLTRRLRAEGFWVRCVDLARPAFADSAADEFVVGDLRDAQFCESLVDFEFDELYQLAANMGGAGFVFDEANDLPIMSDSASINLNVLRACGRLRKPRLLFASSACVYPLRTQLDPEHPDCREDRAYPAEPDSAYGWEKLFAERLYLALHEAGQARVSVVRLHNVFGPECTWRGGREKAPAALSRKVAEACDGSEIEVWGDGRQTRSFLYITECLEGMRRLMESDFPGPVNLGSEEMISIAELARMIIEISGKHAQLRFVAGLEGVRGRRSHNQLIYERLGWRPVRALRPGLERTYRWVEGQVELASMTTSQTGRPSA